MWGDAERDGTVQPGLDKVQGALIHVCINLMSGPKKVEPESLSNAQCQGKRQCAQTERHEIAFKHEKKLYYCESDQAINRVCPEKLLSFCSWRYSKPDRTWPWETCSYWHYFEQKGSTRCSPEVCDSLNYSVTPCDPVTSTMQTSMHCV